MEFAILPHTHAYKWDLKTYSKKNTVFWTSKSVGRFLTLIVQRSSFLLATQKLEHFQYSNKWFYGWLLCCCLNTKNNLWEEKNIKQSIFERKRSLYTVNWTVVPLLIVNSFIWHLDLGLNHSVEKKWVELFELYWSSSPPPPPTSLPTIKSRKRGKMGERQENIKYFN